MKKFKNLQEAKEHFEDLDIERYLEQQDREREETLKEGEYLEGDYLREILETNLN